MAQDKNHGGADEPEEEGKGVGPPEHGQTDDEETHVKMLLRNGVIPDLHRLGRVLVDEDEAADEEARSDEEKAICEAVVT